MINLDNILLIVGMCLVTAIPRFLPLLMLSSRTLNPTIERWLRLVPPAVLAAILVPEIFIAKNSEGVAKLAISTDNYMLLAAIPSFLVAWFTRSFFGAVIAGMLTVAALRYFAV